MLEILNKIRQNSECIIYKESGLPQVGKDIKLPADLIEFYQYCGGVSMFQKEEFGFRIVKPEEVVLANPIIVGELCEEDISSQWYIIAKDKENNYITMDFSKERLGKCYDSFWDRHGVVGECAVVARNFTELLENLYYSKGKYLYWLEEDFISLGDAYDI